MWGHFIGGLCRIGPARIGFAFKKPAYIRNSQKNVVAAVMGWPSKTREEEEEEEKDEEEDNEKEKEEEEREGG